MRDPAGQAGRVGMTTGGGALFDQAGEIFLAVRELGLAARDEAIDKSCAGNVELKNLVHMLLRGDQAPLPVESLADNIREAASDPATADVWTRPAVSMQSGSRIGNYKVLERLGEGGFGIVYMAEQEKPVRRRVALKIIKLGMDTRQVVARFEAERQALAMMDHPGIARVFDAGATETGRPYFVMELVRGLPITQYCDQHSMTIRQRLELVARVCEALQHAHQKGVIHRDIKPSNVLVSTIDDKPVAKIIDFGIAKATSDRLTDKTIFTEFRQMMGTPEYMSPEQAGQSHEDVDTRTDVYAVGVLLYELLTGSTPFDSTRLRSAAYGEMQRIIREEDPPKPSTRLTKRVDTLADIANHRAIQPSKLSGAIRGELDWIVMKAMEKNRARRYDSAGAMAADLTRYLKGDAVVAAPPSKTYLVRKFVRRNKGPVLATMLLAIALVLGLVGTTLGFFNAERERKVAEGAKKRADEKADEALIAQTHASRSSYSANMLSACAAMESNQIETARLFLEAAPADLRDWEWRALISRLDTSIRSLPCSVPNWDANPNRFANGLLPHPDGESFFTLRSFDVIAAQRWDAATGALVATFDRPAASAPNDFSRTIFELKPDGFLLSAYAGSRFLTGSASVATWDMQTSARTFRADLPGFDGVEGVLGISPDGLRLLRGDPTTRSLILQNVADGTSIAKGDVQAWAIEAQFSGDGNLIAGSDDHGTIQLLDGHTLGLVATLTGHTNVIAAFDFSRDGRWLASASIDSTVRIWDLQTTPPSSIVLEHPINMENVRFSPDASLVATLCTDHAIRVWNARNGALVGLFASGRLLANALMFMPDGRTVAGRERDGTVRFWDITADSTVNLRGHEHYIEGAYFADNPGLIVSAGWDGWKGHSGCVRFWDSQTGEQVASIGKAGEIPYVLAVSSDGARAAISITEVESQWTPRDRIGRNRVEIIDLIDGHVHDIDFGKRDSDQTWYGGSLAFDPTGRMLAVSRQGRLEIRSAIDGSLLRQRTTDLEREGTLMVTWSSDGGTLAGFVRSPARESIDIVLLLDAQTLQTVREIACNSPCAIGYSPTGETVCIGTLEGDVRMFDVKTGTPQRTLPAHNQHVRSISFSPDGRRLATVGGYDGDIVIWNTSKWDRVARFHEDAFVGGAAWDSTGTRLLGACDRTIRLWDDTPWRQRVEAREARKQALAEIEPMIAKLFDELNDAAKVIEHIQADSSLNTLARKTALQVAFRLGIEQSEHAFDAANSR